MMDDTAWDDLQLFLQVATAGGLSGAAVRTGISAPTIGRRMLALENALGRTLFERSHQGYRLAHEGEVLLAHVRTMAAAGIADWRFTLPIVTLAAESWIAGFLADHAGALRTPPDTFRLCCRGGIDDLAFRGMHVMVMHAPPSGGNYASLRSVTMRYAVYAARTVPAEAASRWIAMATETARTPPERIGDPVASLDHPIHIVSHDDERQRPEVRLVIERLSVLLRTHAQALNGGPASPVPPGFASVS
jgi:hypothetical protein